MIKETSDNSSGFPEVIYEDDICKIVAVSFTDSDETDYYCYLPLTFENRSNEAFVVVLENGTMDSEKVDIVCIESGKADYELVVMPNEARTEMFQVNYEQTSIRSLNKVKTIEVDFTLLRRKKYLRS